MTWPPSEKARWIATLAAFAVLVVMGVLKRLELLEAVTTGQVEGVAPELTGDAASYYRLALGTSLPCFSTEREPGILVVGRVALKLFGNAEPRTDADVRANHLVLRRNALVLSLLAMSALFGLALLVAGRVGALVAALLWADNLWLSMYGVGFLREDLAAAFLFGFLAALVALFRQPAERKRLRIALVAAAAVADAGMALTRLEGLGTATLLVGAWCGAKALSKRFSKQDAIAAGAIVAATWLLVSPYLVFNLAKTGSAFHPMHAHARFWRNHEFAGQPGFPTRAEVIADSYTGPPETPSHYVWGLHSVLQVIGREVAGLWKGFTHDLAKLLAERWWLGWLVPIAAGALARRRRWEGAFVLAAGLVALLPFAFILTLNTVLPDPNARGVEPRFALPALWFAILWVGGGVGAFTEWVEKRRAAAA